MARETAADYARTRRNQRRNEARPFSRYDAAPPHRRQAAERECARLGIDPRGTTDWPL